ncbi:MAG: prepilin-type N-terminal cleavage/methylation domain-containing protein [Phycisphaerae bacterium]|nr:prepilin-type N-terminal cleavage/methylation domain-containing protein [Phycisphaerae bacterium]
MRNKGFTFIEVMIAVFILGLAVIALVGANTAFTQVNGAGVDLATAEFLMLQIKEMTALVSVVDPQSGTTFWGPETGETSAALYDDLDDFDGRSFSPPINSQGIAMSEYGNFIQQVTVENVRTDNFSLTASHHSTPFVRVTVDILLNGETINSASWLRTRQ